MAAKAQKLSLPRLKQESLAQRAYQELKSSILSGQLRPGAHLAEVELAEALDISRTPVREALALLKRDGLVETIPGGGTMVRTLSSEEVRELFLIREALERLAIDELVKRSAGETIGRLQTLLDRQSKAAQRDDVEQFLAADEEFHLTIAQGAGLVQAAQLLSSLREKMRQAGLRAVLQRGRMDQVITEHRAIVKGLDRSDLRQATKALLQHLSETRRAFESQMPGISD